MLDPSTTAKNAIFIKMNKRPLLTKIIPLSLLVGLATSIHISATDYSKRAFGFGAVPNYEVDYEVPQQDAILESIDRMFGYTASVTTLKVFDNASGEEIKDPAKITDTAVVDRRFGGFNNWDYTNGVIISSFDLLYELTGESKYLDYNTNFYDFIFKWMPAFREREETSGIRSPYHKMINMEALDHCGSITAALIKTYRRHQDATYRGWIDVVADFITNGQFRLEDGSLARQRPQAVSLWTDDFYMSIPFLAQMGKLTGETKFYDDATRQVIQLSDRLFDWDKELYDHGWSEVSHPYDPKHYWARANGWAMMAMAELLTVLPEDHPDREKVLHIFRTHVKGVVERQEGDGLWHNMLNRELTYTETSASSMFVFSIARAINEGWLPAIYAPYVFTGWNGIAERITPDGRVKGVCEGTTYANDAVYYTYRGAGEHTTFFGATLLAAAETLRLLQNPELEIINSRPNRVNSAIHVKPAYK